MNKEIIKISAKESEIIMKIEEILSEYGDNTVEEIFDLVRKYAIQECIELSNEIELREPDGGTREWMAFKKFRNKMRDKLKS